MQLSQIFLGAPPLNPAIAFAQPAALPAGIVAQASLGGGVAGLRIFLFVSNNIGQTHQHNLIELVHLKQMMGASRSIRHDLYIPDVVSENKNDDVSLQASKYA